MPDTPSITIVKRFTYRGVLEEYSNSYHFTGSTPGTLAGWKTLADALIAEERKVVDVDTKFVRAYGYEAGNEHSVATIDYVALGAIVAGSFTGSGSTFVRQPGDVAVWIRCLRDGRSEKGKNVYARKFFHGVYANGDNVDPALKTALTTLGTKLISGDLPGSFKWSAPQGQALTNPVPSQYTTTRTLKRRGKRPSS